MDAITRFLKRKWVLYLLLCTPVFYVFTPSLRSDTEFLADPAKFLLEYVGLAATIIFVIVLSITPLRRIFPKASLVKVLAYHRRAMGVSVFVYATLHFVIYFFYTGSWAGFVADWDKWFILSGLIAFVLLGLLAFTSNNRAVRALKGKNWKRLHRLAYLIMFLLIFHQATQEKTGYRETAKVFTPLLILQTCRIALLAKDSWFRKRAVPPTSP